MATYGLIVRFQLKQGAAERFDKLVAETVEQIRQNEPDTLVYDVLTVAGEPDVRIFVELYRNEAAFRFHEERDHTRRFLSARGAFLEDYTVTRTIQLVGTTVVA